MTKPGALPSPTIANRIRAAIATVDRLDVREFSVVEQMSSLFRIQLRAHCDNPNLGFDDIAGQPATLTLVLDDGTERTWKGICCDIQQAGAAIEGYSTYELTIVPLLWLASQRRNHRMYQQMTEPAIVEQLLDEWSVDYEMRIDPGEHPVREYRVQYGESDYDFICRLLEHSGISFCFDEASRLIVTDAPHAAECGTRLDHHEQPSEGTRSLFATKVRVGQRVRPGRYVLRDRSLRQAPDYPLLAEADGGLDVEAKLERFHYVPGAFLCGSDVGPDTPSADDKGRSRADEGVAAMVATKRLNAKRASAQSISFSTNAQQLAPGAVARIDHHPSSVLGQELLLLTCLLSGSAEGDWSVHCEAVRTTVPYRPPLRTAKPKVIGVETATVVGPPGEEIHTDELGRARVHFHWDRYGDMDDNSSCWIHVSHPWGGAGFGGMNLPRVGQEVIVDFVGGDPDVPVIVGRLFTGTQKVPYALPAAKAQSGWRSNTYPGGGGYNELMFDDSKDKQLLNMQAEKDMNLLVKHDETAAIGNDRQQSVGHDESRSVGNDRSTTIGNDESLSVGNDRSTTIGNDESLSVGNDQTTTIGNNRSLTVSNNDTVSISNNAVCTVSNDWRTLVGGNASMTCSGSSSRSVGLSDSQTVGALKSLSVIGAYTITVGAAMSTTVVGLSREKVGLSKKITAGTKIELVCGSSSIILEEGGTITIKGVKVVVEGSSHVDVDSALIELN